MHRLVWLVIACIACVIPSYAVNSAVPRAGKLDFNRTSTALGTQTTPVPHPGQAGSSSAEIKDTPSTVPDRDGGGRSKSGSGSGSSSSSSGKSSGPVTFTAAAAAAQAALAQATHHVLDFSWAQNTQRHFAGRDDLPGGLQRTDAADAAQALQATMEPALADNVTAESIVGIIGQRLPATLPTLNSSAPELQRGVAVVVSDRGESCHATCARVSAGDLVCLANAIPHMNSCPLLQAAYGCALQCSASLRNGAAPAAMFIAGEDEPMCVVAPHDAPLTCLAADEGVSRLCPCGQAHTAQDFANILQDVVDWAEEAEQEHAEYATTARKAIRHMVRAYNATATQLQVQLDRSTRLARAGAILHAVHSGHVDYEAGTVRLGPGEVMSLQQASKEVATAMSLQSTDVTFQHPAGTGSGSGEHASKVSQGGGATGSGESPGTAARPSVGPAALGQGTTSGGSTSGKPLGTGPDASSSGGGSRQQPLQPGGTDDDEPGEAEYEDATSCTPSPGKPCPKPEDGSQFPLPGVSSLVLSDPAVLMINHKLLRELVMLIAAAGVAGAAATAAGMPSVLGYLLAGAIIGPNSTGYVEHVSYLASLGQLGVIVPMFTTGLQFGGKLSTAHAGGTTRPAMGLAASMLLVHVPCAALLLWSAGLCRWGWSMLVFAVCTGLASPGSAISNLSDSKSMDTWGGLMVLGFLAAQDLVVGVAMAVPGMLSGFARHDEDAGNAALAGSHSTPDSSAGLFWGVMGLVVLLVTVWGIARCAVQSSGKLASMIQAASAESLLLLSCGICTAAALIAENAGLSLETGAFLAGLALSAARNPNLTQPVLRVLAPINYLFTALFFGSVGLVLSLKYMAARWPELFMAVSLPMVCKGVVTLGALIGIPTRRVPAQDVATVLVATSTFAELGIAIAARAAALGHMARPDYLLLLSATSLSLVVTPVVTKASPALQALISSVCKHRLSHEPAWQLARGGAGAETGGASPRFVAPDIGAVAPNSPSSAKPMPIEDTYSFFTGLQGDLNPAWGWGGAEQAGPSSSPRADVVFRHVD